MNAAIRISTKSTAIPHDVIEPILTHVAKHIYTIVEIPPPPYCHICKKYIMDNKCANIIQSKQCLFNNK